MQTWALLRLQLQIFKWGIDGQGVKSVIEDLSHLFELFWRIELDIEFWQKHHEFVEGYFCLRMKLHHLLHHLGELILLNIYLFWSWRTKFLCFHIIFIIPRTQSLPYIFLSIAIQQSSWINNSKIWRYMHKNQRAILAISLYYATFWILLFSST